MTSYKNGFSAYYIAVHKKFVIIYIVSLYSEVDLMNNLIEGKGDDDLKSLETSKTLDLYKAEGDHADLGKPPVKKNSMINA